MGRKEEEDPRFSVSVGKTQENFSMQYTENSFVLEISPIFTMEINPKKRGGEGCNDIGFLALS